MIEGVNEVNENKAKEQKGGLLSIVLGTWGTISMENLRTKKCTITAGGGTIRAVQSEIQKYY